MKKMFCPNCGSEENQNNQFCRSCGTKLNPVRVMLDSPDSNSASAVSARDEIGRAVAAKIQQTNSTSELSTFAEDVLPEIEKFLESPEERKLRRIRVGSTISFIGLAVTIGFFIASFIGDEEVIFLAALGLVTFFVGLSLIVNGILFTIPKKSLTETSINNQPENLNASTNELLMPQSAQMEFSSVTEHTTRHLKNKKPTSTS